MKRKLNSPISKTLVALILIISSYEINKTQGQFTNYNSNNNIQLKDLSFNDNDSCYYLINTRFNGVIKNCDFAELGLFDLEFKEGKPLGKLMSKHSNGKIKLEGVFKKGIQEINIKTYFMTGVLKEEGYLANFQKTGKWKFYHTNGVIREESTYLNGKMNGLCKRYFENGKLGMECTYVEGNMEGFGKYYLPKPIYKRQSINAKININCTWGDLKYKSSITLDDRGHSLDEQSSLINITSTKIYGKEHKVNTVDLLNTKSINTFWNGFNEDLRKYIVDYGSFFNTFNEFKQYDIENLDFSLEESEIVFSVCHDFMGWPCDYCCLFNYKIPIEKAPEFLRMEMIFPLLFDSEPTYRGTIEWSKLKTDAEGYKCYNGIRFSGTAVNTDITKIVTFEESYDKGILHGKYREFYPNGALLNESNYVYGKLNGISIEYYDWAPIVHSTTYYKNDEPIGVSTMNDKNGKQISKDYNISKTTINSMTIEYIDDLTKKRVININQLKKGYDNIWSHNGIKYNGKTFTVFNEPYVYAEWNIKDGILNGLAQSFHSNGSVKSEGFFNNGFQEGPWKYYYETGELMQEGPWNLDKKDGLWITYYKSGVVQDEGLWKENKQVGIWKYYEETGKLLNDTLYESMDIKPLTVNSYELENGDDGLSYHQGRKFTGLAITYHKKNIISTEANYMNGVLNGTYKSYYKKGNAQTTGNYQNGFYHGQWITYAENGNPQTDIYYINGKIEGQYKLYHKNGKLSMHGYYKNEKPVGVWKYYDERGNLFSEIDLKDGK